MKYLCLVYQEESSGDTLPVGLADATADEVFDYREELRISGHLIASSPLQSAQTATTIRVRAGRVSVSDAPVMESKEQLGEFYLIEARDLNDAIRVASKIPSARIGCVEVRPLRECDPQ
jgi:hypothetical protein